MSEIVTRLPWIHTINAVILGILGLISIALYFVIPSATKSENKKAHAVITGGSSGIGLGLAKECAEAGVQNITLVARNKVNLEKVRKDLSVKYPSTKFHVQSLDVADYKAVQAAGKAIIKDGGPPTLLFNNAGITAVYAFQDVPIEDFEKLMRCNYLGVVYMTKVLAPSMPPGSNIMMTSSMAGALGVYGYTCYTPTKFAIRGFAESLQSEVRRDGISVSLSFPPDTDTPMFEAENKTKPKETHMISDAAGMIRPEVVAKTMVKAALSANPPFFVYFALEGWMLNNLTAGMSPVHGFMDALTQVTLMGLFRLISLVYLWDFTRIISKCGKEKKA